MTPDDIEAEVRRETDLLLLARTRVVALVAVVGTLPSRANASQSESSDHVSLKS